MLDVGCWDECWWLADVYRVVFFRGIVIQSFCGAVLKDYFDVETVLECASWLFCSSQ